MGEKRKERGKEGKRGQDEIGREAAKNNENGWLINSIDQNKIEHLTNF